MTGRASQLDGWQERGGGWRPEKWRTICVTRPTRYVQLLPVAQIRTCLIRASGFSDHDFAGRPLIAHSVVRPGRSWFEDVRLHSTFNEAIKATTTPVNLRFIKSPEQDSSISQLFSETEGPSTRVKA